MIKKNKVIKYKLQIADCSPPRNVSEQEQAAWMNT